MLRSVPYGMMAVPERRRTGIRWGAGLRRWYGAVIVDAFPVVGHGVGGSVEDSRAGAGRL